MHQVLTPEALVYDLPAASEPQISPDGQWVVYTLTQSDRLTRRTTSQLWRRAADGSDARQLTWSGERTYGARWSPDGRHLAFISDRVAGRGLFVMPTDGGEAREIARHPESIEQLAWSPDGQWLSYIAPVEAPPDAGHGSHTAASAADSSATGEPSAPTGATAAPAAHQPTTVRVTNRLDYKLDGHGYLGERRRQVFLVELRGGHPRALTTASFDHAWPTWSPDGRWIAVQRATSLGLGSQLALIRINHTALLANEPDAPIAAETRLIGPADGDLPLWSWSPRGDRLLLAMDDDRSSQTDLILYTLATDQLQRVTTDLDCLPHGGYPGPIPAQPVWLDERQVLMSALHHGRSGLYLVDSQTGTLERTHLWPARHIGLSLDASQRWLVQAQTSLTTTGELVITDRTSGATRLITSHSQALLGAAGIGCEHLTIQRAGLSIDAWLLTPPNFEPTRRYPLLLDIHGGPHNLYGENFLPLAHCLASHGFLVVYANPRGSGSYGRQFARAVLHDWGGEDYLDLMAIVDSLVARPSVDAKRLGIYGFSYGGYMTAWAIGQTNRFRAAVCGAPVFDLESFYGTSDVGASFGEHEFGAPPWECPDWYAAHSPSTFAHRAQTPTLIVHGEADERCPIGQGEQMFVALKRAGCEVVFARYPGASHGFSGGGPPEQRVDYLTRTLAWFTHYLQDS